MLLEWKKEARQILNSHQGQIQKPQEDSGVSKAPVLLQVDPSISECDRISADLISDLNAQLSLLNEKNQNLQIELDECNQKSKASHVIASVIQNNMRGQQAAIFELNNRI